MKPLTAPFVAVPVATLASFGLSHNNTLRCLCSSPLAAPLSVLSSCRLMRELPSDETLMNPANMHLSTGSAFTLSVEYCISSYKHLLWQVQGPLFSETSVFPSDSVTELGQGWTAAASPPYCNLSPTRFSALDYWQHITFAGLYDFWTPKTLQKCWCLSEDGLSVRAVTVPRVTLTWI